LVDNPSRGIIALRRQTANGLGKSLHQSVYELKRGLADTESAIEKSADDASKPSRINKKSRLHLVPCVKQEQLI
jgi:hypothetical protein